MRMTSFILLVCCMQVAARSASQTITFSGENVPLKNMFAEIKKQTGYFVFFNQDDLKGTTRVSVSARSMPLADFLQLALRDQPVSFSIADNTIILSRKAVTAPGLDIAPAGMPVTGRVTDSAGNALAGATLTIRGERKTAVTDQQGWFTLEAEPGDLLQVSYVGFETATVRITAGSQPLTIVLKRKPKTEEEVIVSTGYQRLPRERAAGSFGVMDQEALEKRNNLNILTYLEGQVPGLLMAADGQITIRGQSTIFANKDPLIVLDGFPIEKPVDAINANDVESITVLKDASAASIWGVRAANGVIVIQTKRGQSSRKPLDISFSSTFSVTPASDLSKLPFAPSASFIEYEKYKVANGFSYFVGKPRPAISPVVDAYLNNPAQADQLTEPLRNINAYDEFRSLFMAPATRQQYYLAVSGKGQRSTHRASFSYDRVSPEFKHNVSERFVADLFETVKLLPSLTADLGLNYAVNRTKNNGMGFDDLSTLLPYQRILDNGAYVPQPRVFYQKDKDSLVQAGYPYNWDYNLVREFNNKDNKTTGSNVNAVAGLNYTILKGLSANAGYQYESGSTTITNLFNEETYFVRNLVNFSTAGATSASGIPKGSIYRESNRRYYAHTLRGQLRFDGNLGGTDHYLSAIAGTEIRELGTDGSNQTKYGYDPQSLQFTRVDYTHTYKDIVGAQRLIPDETVFENTLNRFVSYFSNVGYTYNDRYTLNASARLDKTNLFGSSKQYRNVWLWSAGASWQLYKENFFNSGLFNSLILRATYGINGNVDRSTSPYLIANVATDYQTNQPYAYVNNPANPLLRWEKTAVTNIGVDFSLLKKRLKGSLESYRRNSTDVLGNSTVNGTYGFNSAYINYASLRNTGTDIRLSGLLIDGAFNWNATLNYSYNKNKVTRVDFPQSTVGAYLNATPMAGRPLNYLYSYAWAGLSAGGAPQVYNEEKNIVDHTQEVSDPLSLIYEGSAVPVHYGALINEFNYKRFSVLMNFVYKMGGKFRVPVIQYQSISTIVYQVARDWDNRWKQAGDEAHTDIPAAPTSIAGLDVYDMYSQYADIHVETSSVIRFRELLVNYRLPAEKIFRKAPGAALSIGLQVRNLVTYKFNKAGLDPEYQQFIPHINNFNLPPRPEYSFIIKANF